MSLILNAKFGANSNFFSFFCPVTIVYYLHFSYFDAFLFRIVFFLNLTEGTCLIDYKNMDKAQYLCFVFLTIL